MYDSDSSPLKHLAANAITFVAGALAAWGMSAYVRHVKEQAAADTAPQADTTAKHQPGQDQRPE